MSVRHRCKNYETSISAFFCTITTEELVIHARLDDSTISLFLRTAGSAQARRRQSETLTPCLVAFATLKREKIKILLLETPFYPLLSADNHIVSNSFYMGRFMPPNYFIFYF